MPSVSVHVYLPLLLMCVRARNKFCERVCVSCHACFEEDEMKKSSAAQAFSFASTRRKRWDLNVLLRSAPFLYTLCTREPRLSIFTIEKKCVVLSFWPFYDLVSVSTCQQFLPNLTGKHDKITKRNNQSSNICQSGQAHQNLKSQSIPVVTCLRGYSQQEFHLTFFFV